MSFAGDASLRLGYRTRAEFHSDGKKVGFYARQSHEVVDITTCPLCHDHLNAALTRLRETTWKGSVEVTVHPETGDALPWAKRADKGLRKIFPQVQTPKHKGPRQSFTFDGVPVVNGCFSQSSLLLNRLLRNVVQDAMGSGENLLDLYCGSGNFSLPLAESREVTGIDHNRAAVAAAQENGAGAFRAGREEAFVTALRERAWDCVLLNPPRYGAKGIGEALAVADAHRIVYVSCDPATLARDLKTLTAAGWNLSKTTAVDMFPHTPHVEVVCRLDRP